MRCRDRHQELLKWGEYSKQFWVKAKPILCRPSETASFLMQASNRHCARFQPSLQYRMLFRCSRLGTSGLVHLASKHPSFSRCTRTYAMCSVHKRNYQTSSQKYKCARAWETNCICNIISIILLSCQLCYQSSSSTPHNYVYWLASVNKAVSSVSSVKLPSWRLSLFGFSWQRSRWKHETQWQEQHPAVVSSDPSKGIESSWPQRQQKQHAQARLTRVKKRLDAMV